MASKSGFEISKDIIAEYLFKETEAKLYVFKKDRTNPTTIAQHCSNIIDFIKLFNFGDSNEKMKINIFQKFFEEDILKEIKCDPDYNEDQLTIQSLENMVIRLLDKKTSKIGELMDLFDVHQSKGENIKDFARRIRIRFSSIKEKRDEYMLVAFMNGLINRKIAKILKISQPKSLDEAVENLKDETKTTLEDDDNNFCVMRRELDLIKSLNAEIEKLKKENEKLRSALNMNGVSSNWKESNHHYPREQRQDYKNFDDRRKCYNCNKTGHIARFCRKAPQRSKQCYNCGGNHLVKFCRQNKLRHMHEDEQQDVNSTDHSLDSDAGSSNNREINMIESSSGNKGGSKTRTISFMPKPTMVEKFEQYINDQGKKPRGQLRKAGSTVISESRNEKAKNKPLVECTVHDQKIKIMFDTGADLNVISKEFAEKLVKMNPSMRIYKSNTKVTCANGTTERCEGKMRLDVNIGPIRTTHVFDIMPNIFPHMFIGLRSMKKYDVMVNPSYDEIRIRNIRLPFVSKTTIAESLNYERPRY